MSTFDALVTDCLQTLQGFGLAQARAAFLSAAVDASATSFTVGDATGFEQGVAEIEDETVFIESVDYPSNILTIAPDGRGWYGTASATHAINKRITMAPVWPRQQVARAINEAILGTFPTLFGVGSTAVTYNASKNTYALPAEAEKVLRVTAPTLGASGENFQINRYSFNPNAPTDTYPTGNTITLEIGGVPGLPINVTYLKQPTEITFGDTFTECGLAETAKTAIKYAACSLLTAFMDTSRLPVGTAQADEYDPSKAGIGTASRISVQLYQRYLLELETERKRLRAANPTPIVVRTR
jgi:hypothetical protein